MIKKYSIFFLSLVLSIALFSSCGSVDKQPHPKYVFFFIGDGMGIQQINVAQAFLDSKQELWNDTELVFSQFPVIGLSTTTAYNRYITGSAAAGTALSSGYKTSINTLGLNHDHSDSLFSIAYYANTQGFNVGVATSVSIDHATPGAFYAHQSNRKLYHEVSHDLINSRYRFFGSGGFTDPKGEQSDSTRGDIFSLGIKKGIHFTESLEVNDSIKKSAATIVFSTPRPASGFTLKHRIDNLSGDEATLKDITTLGVDVLYDSKGFFFMVEGGKIDWACHDNDAASVVHEVIDFSEAIRVALDFYKRFPNETLIVVTADHETGGMSLGNREMKYESDIALLAQQKVSADVLKMSVEAFFESNPKATYTQLQNYIFSDSLISVPFEDFEEYQREQFRQTVEKSLGLKGGYRKYYTISSAAIKMLNQKAGIGWTSGAHTASPVPIYALGVGQERFAGSLDNVDIPKRIAEVMGISMD